MAIVYEHLRNDTNEVFYVGMSVGKKRAYKKSGRNPHWYNIVKKAGYTVNIVYKDIEWDEAKKIEILLIEKYGRKDLGTGILVNMTDGGEGALGVIISEENKKKMSKSMKGNIIGLGKPKSEEHKQKLSEANRCRKGVKGYYFNKKIKKFCSSISVMYKTIYLGSFDTPGEAAEAYQKAKLIYHV